MADARTLQPEDRIAHYRIVAPLGAGGMGEVYLAQDMTLERQIALKVLPAELVRSQERVRRFVQEAKSASSLNHPNIVTIHEIGEARVQGEVGEAEEPVRYIAMELVAGKTLATKIYEERTDLRTLLGYLAQAAEGIAKAHAAGIVHRDLKPGNIMVSDDGFAKVLDFGLAKLTEKQGGSEELTSAPTQAGDRTAGGVLLGTAGYMSPEQALGKTVDQRSDLFSFGCILYEAATRIRPFAADSAVETMHKIIHDKPKPVEELNPIAPAELRRLIRKCLAKNPDQRMQSMKDLALDLREIVEEFETLSASASSGSSAGSGMATPLPAARNWSARGAIVAAAVGALGIIGIAFGIYGLRSKGTALEGGESASGALQVASVTSRGGISSVALSPDGRYLAYVSDAGEQSTLIVRQVATGSEMRVLSKQQSLWGVVYSPSGEHVFFVEHDPAIDVSSLFQVPSLGGTPRKIVTNLRSRVGFDPGGRRICFTRPHRATDEESLVIRDLEGGVEKTLATVKLPLGFAGSPAWSPDGKSIVVAVHTAENGVHGQLVAIGAEDGKQVPFGTTGWEVESLEWLPDGSGLLMSAFSYGGSFSLPVWSIAYPGGERRRITGDNNVYLGVSLSRDGTCFTAARVSRVANLWTVAIEGKARPRQLTFNSSSESSVDSFDVAASATILFSQMAGPHSQVHAIGADGEGLRQLTSGDGHKSVAHALPDGGFVGEVFDADRVQHVIRADADGGNLRRVTSASGEWLQDVSPDGKTLMFTRAESPRHLLSTSVGGGGEPRTIATSAYDVVGFSPDGTRVAFATPPELEGQSLRTMLVVPAAGGDPVSRLSLPADSGHYKWTADGSAIAYLAGGSVSNLFRQPLAGGAAQQLTRFTEGQIWSQEWVSGARLVLLNRRVGDVSNLWSVAADGRDPVALTDFVTGSVFDIRPTLDGKTVVFTYGNEPRDAVLVKNFR